MMIKRGGLVLFLLLMMTAGAMQAQDATINLFTTEREDYVPGQALNITWNVSGADLAVLEVYDLAQPDAPINISELPIEGSVPVVIPETAVSGVRLILWAANLPDAPTPVTMYAHLTSMSIDVALAPPCQPHFYFNEAAANICPGMTQTRVGAAYQPFENGFMLWREDTGDVWVLSKGGGVALYAASIYGVYPDNPIPDVPPTGYQTPASGFGKVWGNVKRVRDALGWALGAEVGYAMTVQVTTETARLPYFYMSLPGYTTVRVERGSWSLETTSQAESS